MLPDTAEELTYAGKWHEIFYQNGYAALKELESYKKSLIYEVVTGKREV